jgi:hypothetical protein
MDLPGPWGVGNDWQKVGCVTEQEFAAIGYTPFERPPFHVAALAAHEAPSRPSAKSARASRARRAAVHSLLSSPFT